MKYFLAASVCLSFIITAAIIILPTPSIHFAHAVSSQPSAVLNLSEYWKQQISKIAVPQKTFAQILSQPVVLAAETASESATPSSQLPTTYNLLPKTSYTIALLGDSMIDTLGHDLKELHQALTVQAAGRNFNLLNYGVGGTNIEYGLERLTNDYTYLGEQKTALLSTNPDMIIVASFGYNHWANSESDLNRQWLDIAKIIDTIKAKNPATKIVLAAEQAPYCPTYTDGSANLPQPRKQIECETVIAYLKNMINFATSQKYPLINVYSASLKNGQGNPLYVNQGDHIHPSNEGRRLFAQIAAPIISRNL